MTGHVTSLWRHPIKSHGREAIDHVTLTAGLTMPGDRVWAVTQDNSAHTGTGWASSKNFMIGTSIPALAGLWAHYDDKEQTVSLRHSDLGEFSFHPDVPSEADAFLRWVSPLVPDGKSKHKTLVKPLRGMTDTDYPSISLMNQKSHDAVSQKIGRPLEIERWRGNIWLDDIPEWEEFDWIGKSVRIGTAMLQIREPVVRCMHTAANPQTGIRDADTLRTLRDNWDHQNFGVYAEVIESGSIRIGDKAEVL
jgi:uncharacterized protein YcbX